MIGAGGGLADAALQSGPAWDVPAVDIDFLAGRYQIDGVTYPDLEAAMRAGVLRFSGGEGGTIIKNGIMIPASAPRIGDQGLVLERASRNRIPQAASFGETVVINPLTDLSYQGQESGVDVYAFSGASTDTYLQFNQIDLTGIALGDPVVFSLYVHNTSTPRFSLWVGLGGDHDIGRTRADVDLEAGTITGSGDLDGVSPSAGLSHELTGFTRVWLTSERVGTDSEIEMCRIESVLGGIAIACPQFENSHNKSSFIPNSERELDAADVLYSNIKNIDYGKYTNLYM